MGLLCTYSRCYDSHHSVHAYIQWEKTLHCNVVSLWLGAHIKWSLSSCSADKGPMVAPNPGGHAYAETKVVSHIEAWIKWQPICRRHFPITFREFKCLLVMIWNIFFICTFLPFVFSNTLGIYTAILVWNMKHMKRVCAFSVTYLGPLFGMDKQFHPTLYNGY